MRIVYFGNNRLALWILRWLKEQGEELVGLVIHPPDRRRYGDEILEAAALPNDMIICGDRLKDANVIRQINELKPDIGISVLFGYILRPEIFQIFPKGCINLHPAYLPYNKGAYPNVWSIIDRTPAGVTLHFIDRGIDTGDVIAQEEIDVTAWDTGESFYLKLEKTAFNLFTKTWPNIRSGDFPRIPQTKECGSSHRVKDVEKIDRIELEKEYQARYLIDILRARTFEGYRGAYFEADGKRIYLKLSLEIEND